ncbi:MAG: UDP-N-acetylmuramoyl-L-alanyl-D-glutamate--2,6-diaminopimelate ligase, partial [Clostridia bacterium]|nr:UDP-N-acetylmuramoyl-L-alanyl-D-glutamate--2,6-diaminopimelate ligase [Clostridia bacterium]
MVEEGDLFFAMQGRDEDGANYIAQAVRKGAVAVVCEKNPQVNIPYIIVDNPRRAMSVLAARFYGEKHKSLKLIAVTGTNGKTTTSHLIYRGLLSAGKKAAVIGTLGIYFGKKMRPPTLTTPDPIYLHSLFAEMEHEGIEYVVMEVSAHALQLEKVYGLR